MSSNAPHAPHKHEQRGNAGMKEFKYGNTTVIVHSPLVLMSPEERKQWFEQEWQKGNPILRQIAEAVLDCCRSMDNVPQSLKDDGRKGSREDETR
ncbi:hypothetical protein MAH48_14225 [Anoxybacillus flavithermus]|nr:hypothetical protein [Anoxybacillus flavithermus]